MASMLNRVSVHAAAVVGDANRAHAAGLKRLWTMTYREAQVMTYKDIFVVIMICFVVATAMVPLMRWVGPPKAPSSDAH